VAAQPISFATPHVSLRTARYEVDVNSSSPRRLPLPNVQNQDAGRLERARERGKYRSACVVSHEVVEDAAAKNAVVLRRR
jgi:hypothetical protein